MAGTLRLSNTGTGNGQSTITTAASGDTTYTLPSGGGTFVTTSSTQALTVPFASGTASAPSVTFLGDSNTGIYSPGADQVAVATNGTGRLFVDASGKVGIGATAPVSKLEVDGDIKSAGRGTSFGFTLPDWRVSNSSSGNALVIDDYTTERLRITSAGLVGIGTSSPAYKLDVVVASSKGIGAFAPASSAGITDFSAGGVGWTFTRPDDGSYIHSIYSYNTAGAAKNNFVIQSRNDIVFTYGGDHTNAIETMRLADGKVGIGTTSPAWPLDVNGIAKVKQAVLFEAANSTNRWDLYTNTDDTFRFNYNGSGNDEITITSGGNVGIGTTSPNSKLAVSNGGAESFEFYPADASNVNKINYYNRSGAVYCDAVQNAASHQFAIQGTERVRIDSSGRLLVGTSASRNVGSGGAGATVQFESTGYRLLSTVQNSNDAFGSQFCLGKSRGTTIGSATVVQNNDEIGYFAFAAADGTDVEGACAAITAFIDGAPGNNNLPGRLVLSTTAAGSSTPSERMRIESTGRMQHTSSIDSLYLGSTQGAGTSYAFILGVHSRTGPQTGGTNAFLVYTNGNVENTNNSYAGISDLKLKENIVNAGSQWDDLKALQVRKYNFKKETGQQTHTQIGLVAQEVELVSPGLVSESPDRDEDGNDLGTVTKSVNYSVLYMKAVKALQEAMERIETLEASNTDLLARVSALEAN
jgi:hypothetical protein